MRLPVQQVGYASYVFVLVIMSHTVFRFLSPHPHTGLVVLITHRGGSSGQQVSLIKPVMSSINRITLHVEEVLSFNYVTESLFIMIIRDC